MSLSEDDDVALIRTTLASWGLPVAPGPTRRLATTPAVAALRLVIRLPVEGWEVATLARLLRNGAVDWGRLGLARTSVGSRLPRPSARPGFIGTATSSAALSTG